jgi:uncharacterized RDD family membrane protein YckC
MPTKDGATPYFLFEAKLKLKVPLMTENILGRESGLKTETMSRRHCQIVTKENRWFLADLNSTNGTYLNGKKMKTREWYSMKVGDEVEFGSMVFSFVGPQAKAEADVEKPRAETVSTTLPRDGAATSRVKVAKVAAEEQAASEETPPPDSLGFGIRFGAWFIDYLAIGLLGTIVIFLGVPMKFAPIVNLLTLAAVTIVPLKLYGHSLGKMMLGLKVIGADGRPPGLGKILLREIAGKFIVLLMVPAFAGGILAAVKPVLGVFGFIVIILVMAVLYRRSGEAFWDRWAGTRVVGSLTEE